MRDYVKHRQTQDRLRVERQKRLVERRNKEKQEAARAKYEAAMSSLQSEAKGEWA